MLLLTVKLLMAPTLVVGASLAARRWGPRVGGVLVCVPVVAGSVLVVTCAQQGAQFAGATARAAILGVVPLALFAVVLAAVSRHHGLFATLGCAWVTVLGADAAVLRVRLPSIVTLLVGLLALQAARILLKRHPSAAPVRISTTTPWWDLPARAGSTAGLVVLLTGSARLLGPTATGVLAAFPVSQSVVCGFALASNGHPGVVSFLRGITPGLYGFATFLYILGLTLGRVSAVIAFGLATLSVAAVAVTLIALPTGRATRLSS
jgi:hypothetical protein